MSCAPASVFCRELEEAAKAARFSVLCSVREAAIAASTVSASGSSSELYCSDASSMSSRSALGVPVSATRARRGVCSPVQAAVLALAARSRRAPSRWEGRARTRRASRLLAARASRSRAPRATRSSRPLWRSRLPPLARFRRQAAQAAAASAQHSTSRARSSATHSPIAAASRALSASGSVRVKALRAIARVHSGRTPRSAGDDEYVATACVHSSCSAVARSVAVCIVSYGTVAIRTIHCE